MLAVHNGSATAAVNDDGTFTFDPTTFDGPSYSVTVEDLSDGGSTQVCTVRNGDGYFDDGGDDVRVTCTDAQAATLVVPDPGDGGTLSTTSTSFTPIDGLNALSVNASSGGSLLVALHASQLTADPNTGTYGTAWLGIDVDGVEVAVANYADAFWSQPGNVSVTGIATVGPGPHAVQAVWRYDVGDAATGAFAPPSSTFELDAVMLDSLTTFTGAVTASSAAGDATDAGSDVPMAFPALSVPASSSLVTLVGAQLSSVHAPLSGGNANWIVDLDVDGDPVASGWSYYYDIARSTSPFTLHYGSADFTASLAWQTSGGILQWDAVPSQLWAAGFAEGVSTGQSANLGGAYGWTTFGQVQEGDVSPITFTLDQPRWVLLGISMSEVDCDGNGGSGNVYLNVDGALVTSGYAQSENSNFSTPMQFFTLQHLDAGPHQADLQVQSNGFNTSCHANGARILNAVVLK